ncbi:MAG: hypothetical protein RJA25_1410 [Bacteroidota bacterium]|jgi:hypothetical protein
MAFLQQPSVLILLFIIGIIVKYFQILPKDTARQINKFILNVPLPALVLVKIPFLEMSKEVVFPIASAWIVFLGSVIFAYFICKYFKYDKKTMACIILSCGLGNTSFVGYPVLEYFYGGESIRYAILVDQPGSFLLLSTFGILIATSFSSNGFNWKSILLRLIKFPPFLIFIFALFVPKQFISGFTFDALTFLGAWMIPLAILSLGMQFKFNLKEIPWKKLNIGLSYKLIIAPLFIYILYVVILGKEGQIFTVSVMESAMPPMITSSLLAHEYDLDADLANAFPTIGILCSIPTLLLWKFIL